MPRPLLVAWYLPLAAGLAPVLLVGFLTSALANRLVFLLWALAAAALHAALLRGALGRRWGRGWRRGAVAAVVLSGLAAAFASYAALLLAHRETFELGLRAVAPGLAGLAPSLTAPGTALALAALLAGTGAAAAILGRNREGRLA
ncbi:MAG TPA: hypothetical protein VHQ65_12190 [Thermoanaerobaculia bacterium]|nr:hypothetical protein [Thermoanaerobaculia bacterium]